MGVSNLPLQGKVAIVTGGRRGIGKSIALALAEAGANVALCDRLRMVSWRCWLNRLALAGKQLQA